ncbi:MAG: SsrA-binding protein SmpB [Acidimicrobiia bacterium]
MKTVVTNRSARRDYDISETYEAGLVLTGSEVKSLRAGQADLKDSYGVIRGGEAWLVGFYIAPYAQAREGGHEPERVRKLLLHRREIERIGSMLSERGLTLIPAKVFFRDGIAKVELLLGRGKPRYDKRRAMQEDEQRREMERALRHRGRRT